MLYRRPTPTNCSYGKAAKMSTESKVWYKNWWGVVIAILIWPFFLIWYLWSRSERGTAMKVAGSLGILVLAIILVAAISNPEPKTNNSTAAVSKKPIDTTTSQKSIADVASLNAEVVPILNPVLSDLSNQMTQGESYATQPKAANYNSAFANWKNEEVDKQNVANNNEEHGAYLKADRIYYDAHQGDSAGLTNWDSDAGNLPGDISTWASDEWLVLVDQLMGSPTSNDQQSVNKDLSQYQTDLAKARADLAQS